MRSDRFSGGDGDDSTSESDTVDTTDGIVSPLSHTAFGEPYAIDDPGPATDADKPILTETATDGAVAGPHVRDIFEQAAVRDEPPVWIGFDETVYRGVREAPLTFDSLFRHVWVSGTTGYGKSTLLVNMLVQYAYGGFGFVYVDPKGKDSRDLLRKLPKHRLDDVIWIEPRATETDRSIGLNLLEVPECATRDRRDDEIALRLELLTAVLDTADYWGVDMETITKSMGRAMMQSAKPFSVIDLYFTLLDRDRRFEFARSVDDPFVSEYCREIARMDDETVRPLLKRIKDWVENPAIRQLVAHRESTIDFRDVIDDDRIVIVRASATNADLTKLLSLGVLRNVWSAVRRRWSDCDTDPDPYFVVCDEFDAIAGENLDVESMLARARAMRLSVTLATQYPSQIEPETQKAMRNNCDTLLAFSVNDVDDARILMERFPEYTARDLLEIDRYRCWTRLPLDDGRYSRPVCIDTFPPYPPLRSADAVDGIIERSLDRYGAEPLSDAEILHNPLTGREGEATASRRVAETMAEAIRAVQIREGVREENGWVDVATVDDELETRLARTDDDIEYDPDTLPDVREKSPLVHVQEQNDGVVACLSDTGAAATAFDTGTDSAAGGTGHDSMLADAERALTKRGFSVDILHQDGSSKPDGLATHPRYDWVFTIEAERSTTARPARILQNLNRALANGRVPLFIVRPGESDTKFASRLENILSPPVREMPDGTVRYYNRNQRVRFGGGASSRGGVTAVRPVTTETNYTVWTRDGDERVLSDGETEFARIPIDETLSKDALPASYSFDQETGKYTVYDRGETRSYDSKDAFESDWTPIKRPFVPERELPDGYGGDSYVIVILPNDGDPLLFREGETRSMPASGDRVELLPNDLSDGTPFLVENGADTSTASESVPVGPNGDGVETFATRYLRKRREVTVRQGTVYQAYTNWANEHDLDPTTKQWFTRKAHNVHEFEAKQARMDIGIAQVYVGISLTEAGEEFLDDDDSDGTDANR